MLDRLFGNNPVIVTLDVDTLVCERLRQIIQAGFKIVEINSSDTLLLEKLIDMFPNVILGAGNIISLTQLENCHKAGVHFISSPGFVPEIANTALVYALNYLPGIATLSEAMQIMSIGYTQARPYPATLPYCSLLNKCLPTLNLYPAEIEWEEAEHYLSIPSVKAVSIANPEKKQLKNIMATLCAETA